jgi:hypothetical protein
MVLIFHNKADAQAANLEASEKEALPTVTKRTKQVSLVQKAPHKSFYVLDLSLFSDRWWLPDIKSKADEVVEEVPDDWFKKNESL